MKLTVSSTCNRILLSVVQFTCLLLCHADGETEDIASGSGDVPIDISTNLTTIEPTSTIPNLLVPFSTTIDQPPSSASLYFIPRPHTSSLLADTLPSTLFGLPATRSPSAIASGPDSSQSTANTQLTTIFQLTMTSVPSGQLTASVTPSSPPLVSSPSTLPLVPSPSTLSLVLYIASLSRVVVIDQQQVGSAVSHIRQSLAGLLNLQTTDIVSVDILIQQQKTKQQSSSQISFSAVEFSVRQVHSNSVEQLQLKLRDGEVATVQLSPTETVQLKEIMTSLEVLRVPEGRSSLSSGQVAGIAVGVLAGVSLLLVSIPLITVLVLKANRSKESQEIANLRRTYGYQYESHAMSQWPPTSPLL